MAIFPGSVATDIDLYLVSNNLGTLLTAGIDAVVTTIPVVSTTGFPTTGWITIEQEAIQYTGVTGTSFTGCTRGAGGTVAASHLIGVAVKQTVVAAHHNSLKDEIKAIEQYLSDHLGLTTVVTAAEFERLVGVTSPIQDQLDDKAEDTLVVHLAGSETITGAKTFQDQTLLLQETGGVNRVRINVEALAADREYTVPEVVANASFVMTEGIQSINGEKSFSENINLPSINDTFIGYGRNRIVNGAMRFDQRNEGATAYTPATGNLQTLDCWDGGDVGTGVFTVQRQSSVVPTGFTHAMAITVTTNDASIAAGDIYRVATKIEGNRIRDFFFGTADAKTFTFSFWVRSSVTGTFGVGFTNSAINRNYIGQYTINSADTWEHKSIVVVADTTGTWLSDTGIGVRIDFDLGSGSNLAGTAGAWSASANLNHVAGNAQLISTNGATWYLTGVQLEIGSLASAFEYLPDGVELQIIQRYVEKTFPQGVVVESNSADGGVGVLYYRVHVAGVSSDAVMWRYKVTKRATPTVTFYNTGAAGSNWRNTTDNADSGASSASAASPDMVAVSNAQAAGDGVGEVCRLHAFATAEL